MKILIIGCGQVGSTLAAQLAGENHDVTIIDNKDQKISKLTEEYDIMGYCGNGVNISLMREAGIEDTDILIAVTESDEINLLCCLMAKKFSSCHTIARVRNPIYNGETDFIKAQMGISMTINPEQATAVEIAQLLKYPFAEKIDSFAKGKVQLVKIKITQSSPISDSEIRDIAARTGCDILVCAIERGDEVIIPGGLTRIKCGDMVSFIVSNDKLRDTVTRLGYKAKPVKTAMIVGGDTISIYLTRMLSESGIQVKIIENDKSRCETLDELLPEATIIHGDGTDKHMLLEEGIESVGAFVANTKIDEENIFLSMFAKDISSAKLISKVHRLAFDNIIKGLNIGSVVYPKFLTADYIMQYVRAKQNSAGNNISTLYRLLDDKVEALEFTVHEDSPVIGKPIMNLNLKKGLLICCICRGDRVVIPGGQDTIEKGDSVIIVTLESGLHDIRDILSDKNAKA